MLNKIRKKRQKEAKNEGETTRFGEKVKPYSLNKSGHDRDINHLNKKLTHLVNDPSTESDAVIRSHILEACDSALHSIQSDVENSIMQATQRMKFYESIRESYDETTRLSLYENEFNAEHSSGEYQKVTKLEEQLDTIKAAQQINSNHLNQIRHETDDILFSKYTNVSPKKHWYNR